MESELEKLENSADHDMIDDNMRLQLHLKYLAKFFKAMNKTKMHFIILKK